MAQAEKAAMSANRDKSPDPRTNSLGPSFMHGRPSETAGTHLAHWPPPRLEREAPVMLKVKHPSTEPVKRAKARGWRLTRAMFSEFSDDEG
jgi:hypothetical protein